MSLLVTPLKAVKPVASKLSTSYTPSPVTLYNKNYNPFMEPDATNKPHTTPEFVKFSRRVIPAPQRVRYPRACKKPTYYGTSKRMDNFFDRIEQEQGIILDKTYKYISSIQNTQNDLLWLTYNKVTKVNPADTVPEFNQEFPSEFFSIGPITNAVKGNPHQKDFDPLPYQLQTETLYVPALLLKRRAASKLGKKFTLLASIDYNVDLRMLRDPDAPLGEAKASLKLAQTSWEYYGEAAIFIAQELQQRKVDQIAKKSMSVIASMKAIHAHYQEQVKSNPSLIHRFESWDEKSHAFYYEFFNGLSNLGGGSLFWSLSEYQYFAL